MDIGSKWLKTRQFTKSQIIAVRPNESPYDIEYHRDKIVPHGVTVIIGSVPDAYD